MPIQDDSLFVTNCYLQQRRPTHELLEI